MGESNIFGEAHPLLPLSRPPDPTWNVFNFTNELADLFISTIFSL